MQSGVSLIHLRRQLDGDGEQLPNVSDSFLFFGFGFAILAGICCLARSNRIREQMEQEELEQRARQREVDRTLEAEKQRNLLALKMKQRGLTLELASAHIQDSADQQPRNSTLEIDIKTESSRKVDFLTEGEGSCADIELGATDDSSAMREAELDTSSLLTEKSGWNSTLPTEVKDEEEVRRNDLPSDDPLLEADEQPQSISNQDERTSGSIELDMVVHNEPRKDILIPQGDVSSAVTNLCAICLDSYHEGEVLAWSGNEDCPHYFHQECILDYLVHKEEDAPCPICRQTFLPE